jgi:toxin ParE1/3/4
MRALKVEFRPEADADLAAVFTYVLEISQSFKIASGFALRIKARCDRIGHVPKGGRPRDDLAPGLRIVPFENSTVIAYIIADESVWITNIFYGRRDYEAIYRRAGPDDGQP